MTKRLLFSSALFSVIAAAMVFAADPVTGGQNNPPGPVPVPVPPSPGPLGIAVWVWVLIAVVVVAGGFYLLKGKKK
jgi:hypothetical protein